MTVYPQKSTVRRLLHICVAWPIFVWPNLVMATHNKGNEMTNATHTPGPWICSPNSSGSCQEVCDEDGSPVAAITPQLGDAEMANARLIASAPDLLAALLAIEAAQGNPSNGGDAKVMACIARAAIAKATGSDK